MRNKNRTKVNYAAVMAQRANSYKKNFRPSTAVVDTLEAKIQEFLLQRYAGDNVFIRVTYPDGKRSMARLWEWVFEDMKHGISAKTWLTEKLTLDFKYTKKQLRDFFSQIVLVDVTWNDVNEELGV